MTWCGYLWRRFSLNATFLFLPQAWNRTSRTRGCQRPVSKMHKGLTAAARRTMDQSHKKMASRNTGTPAFLTHIPSAVCVLVCGEVLSWSKTIELSGTFLGRVTICNGSVSYKTHTQKGTQWVQQFKGDVFLNLKIMRGGKGGGDLLLFTVGGWLGWPICEGVVCLLELISFL